MGDIIFKMEYNLFRKMLIIEQKLTFFCNKGRIYVKYVE